MSASSAGMTPEPSLTKDPIARLLWQIAIPASVGMFFNTMFNFVDTFCAGMLGTDALAALSVSFPVFFVMIAIGSGLMQGATALMANAIGSGVAVEVRRIFAQSILLVIGVSVLVSAGGFLATPWVLRTMGSRGGSLDAAIAYMNVMFVGSVFFLLQMTLNAALTAQGNTRVYRNVLLAALGANLLLNPVLMWGWFGLPRLGIAGIALATVLVQIGGCVWLWLAASGTELCSRLPRALFVPDFSLLRRIVGQALPEALNMMTIALGIFVITAYVQQFGREAVAAVGIATRIEQVVLMPVIGLSTAVLSLVGQNHGAGHPHRVRETWLTSIRFGVGLMVIGGGIVWTLGGLAMRVFTSDELIVTTGTHYLFTSSLTLAAYPILFGTVFLMQGLKRPAYGLWIGIYRQVLAPLVVFQTLVFVCGWGLWGVWWGLFLVNWSAAIFALWWGFCTVRIRTEV